jgi:hypothetical protein
MAKTLVLFDTRIGDVPVVVTGSTPAAAGGGAAGGVALASASAGGSAGTLNGAGDIQAANQANPQISSAGINPGATGADNVLAVYTLPASFFASAGIGVNIMVQGNCPNNNAKTIKIIWSPTTAGVGQTVTGGTTIATLTASGAGSTGGFQLEANIFKYGNPGSNTQIALHQSSQVGSLLTALSAPSLLTSTESGPITIAVTGNATTAVGDIALNFLELFGVN